MDDRDLLLMASLIAAVRTARFEDREFQGMASPRMMSQIANSLWLAQKLRQRAVELGVVKVEEPAAAALTGVREPESSTG